MTSSECYGCFDAEFITLIHNNENYGSDMKSLPDLDEFLASSFDPGISDGNEELGDRRMLTA